MSEQVTSPAVRVLDFGWQAPSVTDFAKMGASAAEPVTRAGELNNAAQNAFLAQQINNQHSSIIADQANQRAIQMATMNNDRARELAQWQHSSQLEREKMRDQRFLDVAHEQSKARLDYLVQKQGMTMVTQQLDTLVNRYGGSMPEGDPNEAGYLKKIEAAITAKRQDNIQSDGHRLAHLNIQKTELTANMERYAQSFSTNPEFLAVQKRSNELTALEAQGLAQKAVVDAGYGSDLKDALKSHPEKAAEITALFNARFGAVHEALANKWLSDNGKTMLSPGFQAEARRATLERAELAGIDKQIESTGLMPGPHGGMIPKPWMSDAVNLANDPEQQHKWFPSYYKSKEDASAADDASAAGGDGRGAGNGVSSAGAGPANPVNPRQAQPYTGDGYMAPGYDAQGNPTNTAPLAQVPGVFRDLAMTGNANTFNLPDTSRFMTPQDMASAAKLQSGSALNPIGYLGRGVGSLFDSSVSPMDAYAQQVPAIRFSPLPLPEPQWLGQIGAQQFNPDGSIAEPGNPVTPPSATAPSLNITQLLATNPAFVPPAGTTIVSGPTTPPPPQGTNSNWPNQWTNWSPQMPPSPRGSVPIPDGWLRYPPGMQPPGTSPAMPAMPTGVPIGNPVPANWLQWPQGMTPQPVAPPQPVTYVTNQAPQVVARSNPIYAPTYAPAPPAPAVSAPVAYPPAVAMAAQPPAVALSAPVYAQQSVNAPPPQVPQVYYPAAPSQPVQPFVGGGGSYGGAGAGAGWRQQIGAVPRGASFNPSTGNMDFHGLIPDADPSGAYTPQLQNMSYWNNQGNASPAAGPAFQYTQ